MKARSRLKSSSEITPHFYEDTYSPPITAAKAAHPVARPPKSLPLIPWSSYFHHLLTLMLALVGYGFVGYMILKINPLAIENIGLPHLYLPFQIAFFLSNLFLFSFLLLNTRRGYLISLWVQILLFLKLQMVLVTWQLGLGLLIVFVIIEGLISLTTLIPTQKYANVQQATGHRHRKTNSGTIL